MNNDIICEYPDDELRLLAIKYPVTIEKIYEIYKLTNLEVTKLSIRLFEYGYYAHNILNIVKSKNTVEKLSKDTKNVSLRNLYKEILKHYDK